MPPPSMETLEGRKHESPEEEPRAAKPGSAEFALLKLRGFWVWEVPWNLLFLLPRRSLPPAIALRSQQKAAEFEERELFATR